MGIGFLQLTDIRHNWGVRSIHAGLDARVASKSLGHSINTHYEIYNSTYEQIDAIKASKKLNNWQSIYNNGQLGFFYAIR